MSKTYKLFADKMPRVASTYIGNAGEIFYDPAIGFLRLSDGTTPGGQPLTIDEANVIKDGNIIPSVDNTYTLGSPTQRWAAVYIGPGSLYIQDTNNAGLNVELTVTNGVLQISGANQLVAQNLAVQGNFTFTGYETIQPNFITVSGTGTYSASTTVSTNVLLIPNSSTNITWTMPPNPVDGQICTWTNSGYTTVFSVASGATLIPALSGPYSSGYQFKYVYHAATSKWYAIP